jgi:hypothetical protein
MHALQVLMAARNAIENEPVPWRLLFIAAPFKNCSKAKTFSIVSEAFGISTHRVSRGLEIAHE